MSPGTPPNILAARYASPEMRAVFGPIARARREREVWLAVLEAQRAAGLEIPAQVVEDYRRVLDRVDLASIEARERRNLHDVKARLEEFNALAGHERAHLGLTSRDLTETVDQLQMAAAAEIVRRKAAAVLLRLSAQARREARTLLAARTHHVPAQMTTVGRRLAMHGEELLTACAQLETWYASWKLRGLHGAVGTRLDLLTLLGGSPARLARFDREFHRRLGFGRRLECPGQVYPRSADFELVTRFAAIAFAGASFATTLRLMAGLGLATEGFAEGQTGSSAMPHKTNARNCERICGLRAILVGHVAMTAENSGQQWNEGDVACSVVRRVVLPDSAYAVDGLLETWLHVLDRWELRPAALAREWSRELPFLATTRILMAAVQAGRGREEAHAAIKAAALAARRAADEGAEPDLVGELIRSGRLGLEPAALRALVGPQAGLALAGLAPTQARAFARRAERFARKVDGAAETHAHPIL